eukprot:jgi/Picsp_1/4803/NSC_02171-R1_protein
MALSVGTFGPSTWGASKTNNRNLNIKPKYSIISQAGREDVDQGRRKRTGRESLLDNIEITPEERQAIAERLRRRREARQKEKGGTRNERASRSRYSEQRVSEEQVRQDGTDANGWYADSNSREDPYLGWGDELYDTKKRSYSASSTLRGRRIREEQVPDYEAINDNEEEEEGASSYGEPPDIVILSPQELDRMLPILPFAAQADYFSGGAAQAVQRWGASLALTVLLSKAALLAATSLTWPLWWPWAQAANKNYGIRKQTRYGGIWRTTLRSIETGGRPRPRFGTSESAQARESVYTTMRTTKIVLGEEDGAQTELMLPYDARFEVLQVGQPAEMIVLSDTLTFENFKAVKDVYLPESTLWLSEYPYIDRSEFLDISLNIEREVMSSQYSSEENMDDFYQY